MVRAITFDAFGTLIDTGRDVLIRIARSVCEDQRPSLDPEALLATWDRHFFAAETAPFLTLAAITEDSLEKTFREYGIEATPAPYVDHLVALWRQAKAYAEVPRILDALDGVPRAVVSNADHEFLLDVLERNGLRPVTFFAQNDGTLMDLEFAIRFPVLTIGSGPANSIRGAAYLTGRTDAIVVDVGGTSTDLGVLVRGFPRESSFGVEIGGIRTNFRMPDLVTIALGGARLSLCRWVARAQTSNATSTASGSASALAELPVTARSP